MTSKLKLIIFLLIVSHSKSYAFEQRSLGIKSSSKKSINVVIKKRIEALEILDIAALNKIKSNNYKNITKAFYINSNYGSDNYDIRTNNKKLSINKFANDNSNKSLISVEIKSKKEQKLTYASNDINEDLTLTISPI
jgi:hypothetical protein